MNRPVRVGVIGAAYAANSHLPVLTGLPGFEVVAVATSRAATADAAAERFGVARPVEGYQRLCRDPDVELVVVATRPRLHREMALAAIEAGKHVLCEAPLAMTVAEGEEMAQAAEKAGVLAVTGMQSRFSPGISRLRGLVREGRLGRVENVQASAYYPTFTRPEAIRAAGWCADAANGASSLRVHGLHTADLIRWIFGEFAGVAGTVATRRPYWPGEDGPVPATSADSSVLTATVGDGALCSLHTSWVAQDGDGWRLTAHGSAGRLVATAQGHTGHFPVTLRGALGGEPMREIASDPPDVGEFAPDAPTYPLARMLRQLAVAISGGKAEDLPTFADGVAALRLAEAIEPGRE
ncbi:Gfo/Idh/MocA family protein [Amycolatopsis nigrescens]|uniref:Gfo/Idh/MocA family protein n=1 Tax=Amycolatopsis nigrescens TaxID=381445 RepID=UPI0003810E63|nr:Gfo/Idh/MocA family oxidoreductase [Amycolatopsis nigrescens]